MPVPGVAQPACPADGSCCIRYCAFSSPRYICSRSVVVCFQFSGIAAALTRGSHELCPYFIHCARLGVHATARDNCGGASGDAGMLADWEDEYLKLTRRNADVNSATWCGGFSGCRRRLDRLAVRPRSRIFLAVDKTLCGR